MTRSIRRPRRAALLLGGAATATALLLSGCGTGQIAETAAMVPTVSGVNIQTADNLFGLRNLAVRYLDPEGYPTGGDAPLEVTIFNDSLKPVTVTVTSPSARAVVLGGALAPTPRPSASASASASATPAPTSSPSGSPSVGATGSPEPTASAPTPPPVEQPASILIPAGEYVVLNKTSGSFLQLAGLNAALPPGQSVQLVFDFNGQQVKTPVPVAIPLTPPPSATAVVGGEGHGG